MADQIQDNAPGGRVTFHIPTLHSKEDVWNIILHIGNMMRDFDDDYFSHLIPQLSVSDEMVAQSRHMRLDPVSFARDVHHGLSYMINMNQDDPPVPKMARVCKTCRQCWPSFVHFLFTPSAPEYLECPECTKRIPVGVDIHVLPQRKVQPSNSNMGIDGNPLDLESIEGNGAGPIISTKQRCTSPSCPLKDHAHPIGLFSYPHIPKLAVPAYATALRASPNRGIPEFYPDTNFWGGNDRIPRAIDAYAATILREEAVFRGGDRMAIESFRNKYPRGTMDSMREAVEAFRAFHCGYGMLSISKSLQLDQYPEHLRTGAAGSQLWVDTFIAGLPRVAIETLAEDDRECGICKGVYNEDVGTGGEIEKAVRLPCTLVLGAGCLAELLLEKKCGGMGHHLCPLCRRHVYEPTAERPWEDYATSLALNLNCDMPLSERLSWFEEHLEVMEEE